MHAIFGYLAGMLVAARGTLYLVSILKGATRPNKASWFIWAAIDGIILESYWRLGARETIFVPLVLLIRALVVVGILLWLDGSKLKLKLKFFDKICLGGAAISLIPRLIFQEPFITVAMTLIILAIGAAPTIRKIYLDSGGEDKTAWALLFVSFMVNLFAVNYDGKNLLDVVIYPAGVFCTDAAIIGFLFAPTLREFCGKMKKRLS